MFELHCPKCTKVFKGDIWEPVADDYSKHIAAGCVPSAPPQYKNVADVVPEEVLKGNLVSMEDLIGKVLLVKEFVLRESTFKEDTDYLGITVDVDGEEKVVNTGAERVVQVFKALDPLLLPLYVIFEKVILPNGRRVYRVKGKE